MESLIFFMKWLLSYNLTQLGLIFSGHWALTWWHCCFMKVLMRGAELEALTEPVICSSEMSICCSVTCAYVRRLQQQRRSLPGASSEMTSWWEAPWRTGTKRVMQRTLIHTRRGRWRKVIQSDTIQTGWRDCVRPAEGFGDILGNRNPDLRRTAWASGTFFPCLEMNTCSRYLVLDQSVGWTMRRWRKSENCPLLIHRKTAL